MGCFDEELAVRLFEKTLPATDREAAEEHMDTCETCRRLVSALAKDTEDSASVETHGERAGSEGGPFAGDRIGRLSILHTLGQGGMGTVYAAYDAKLDRKVALKFLRFHRRSESRLLREARLLAQLSHPNVVQVHDIGEYQDRSYISMEYCKGQTLGAWYAEGTRSWQDVIRIMSLAGQGLSAAHRAGLVHRDFKPSNVMVNGDEDVKVMDLGLARRERDEHQSPGEGDKDDGESSVSQATKTGTMLGTPRYMSPEQFRGELADTRSDQFSFCVSLYELLYGTSPFAGKTLASRTEAFGKAASPPPEDSEVPGYLWLALMRGLQVDPDARFRDVDTLLEALVPQSRRRGVRWLVAFGTAVSVAAIAMFLLRAPEDVPSPCANTGQTVEAIWNEGARERVRNAIGDARVSEELFGRLEMQASELRAGYHDNCQASHVRRDQSDDLLDRRTQCLNGHVARFSAMISLFSDDVDDELRAGAARVRFESLEQCSNTEALASIIARPTDPARLKRLHAVTDEEARASALESAGKLSEAERAARTSVALARKEEYPPVLGYSLLTLARILRATNPSEAVEVAREAIEAAAVSHDDLLLSHVWEELLALLADEGGFEEALALRPAAEASLRRIDAGNHRFADLYVSLGNAFQVWQPRRSIEMYLKARELFLTASEGEQPRRSSMVENNLANTYANLGNLEKAAFHFEEALAITEERKGPNSSKGGIIRINLASAYIDLKMPDKAEATLERARENLVESLDSDHILWAHMSRQLGQLAVLRGDFELALSHASSEARAFVTQYGPLHHQAIRAREHRASAFAGSGDLAGAMTSYDELIDELVATGDNPETLIEISLDISDMLIFHKKKRAAIPYLDRARLVLQESSFPEGFYIAAFYGHLASTELEGGRIGKAKEALALAEANASSASEDALAEIASVRARIAERTKR